LEAQAKELENSNRILRMKVVGSDDAVYHNKVNMYDNAVLLGSFIVPFVVGSVHFDLWL
jgi:hypothetical protein